MDLRAKIDEIFHCEFCGSNYHLDIFFTSDFQDRIVSQRRLKTLRHRSSPFYGIAGKGI